MNCFRVNVVAALLGLTWLVGCGGPDWSLIDETRPLHLRPSHYGISLPYPVSGRPFVSDTSVVPSVAERLVPLALLIDSSGRVVGIEARSPADQPYAAYYADFLEQFRFEPGLRDGQISDMTLLVELQVGAPGSEPIVRFPVDPNRAVLRSDQYWRAFAELGIEVPALVSFPSYDYRLRDSNRWRRYPFKVYRVELDSAGAVLSSEPVRATNPYYGRQIKSAIHWGEYSPLRIDGQAYRASCFLIVSLYPMVDYPSEPLFPDSSAILSSWDRARVQLVPDTLGLLLPPVPKREWSGEILDSFHQGLTPELVSNRLVIDSSGQGRLGAISTDFHRARRVLLERSHNILFLPATRLDGSTEPFVDIVYLRYLDESNVRIWFNWLGGSDPGPPVQQSAQQ